MRNLRLIPIAAALSISGALLAATPIASAKGGDSVRVAGVCTHDSTSKLKLSGEDGKVEVEFEVDQNRNGVPWKVSLRRNGALVTSTTATTRAPSGSFTVRRAISGAHGTFTAVATRSGETCKARASF